jgi:hypothetical protein
VRCGHIDRDGHGTIALFAAFEVVPGFLALDYMRIGIDGQHAKPSKQIPKSEIPKSETNRFKTILEGENSKARIPGDLF